MSGVSMAITGAIALLSGPATFAASTGTPVPEPGDFALFAAALAGLAIGRACARPRRDPWTRGLHPDQAMMSGIS